MIRAEAFSEREVAMCIVARMVSRDVHTGRPAGARPSIRFSSARSCTLPTPSTSQRTE